MNTLLSMCIIGPRYLGLIVDIVGFLAETGLEILILIFELFNSYVCNTKLGDGRIALLCYVSKDCFTGCNLPVRRVDLNLQ